MGSQYKKSITDKQRTPQFLFDRLNLEFKFTLDVAAADSPEMHRCDEYFTEADDGLSKQWPGTVWCNPPYSDVQPWITKAYEESCSQDSTVVMLVMASTGTQWFNWVFRHAAEIRFITGRLKFGAHQTMAPFPSMIIVFKGAREGNADVSVINRDE